MHAPHISFWKLEKDARLILPAALLGACAALFINGYWLTDILPADIVPVQSKLVLGLTVACGLLAALGYWKLLVWIRARMRDAPVAQRLGLALLAAPVAAFVFLGGTHQWRDPNRYLTFLLPVHRLEISAFPSMTGAKIGLVWFNTSLGDVSFNAIQLHGWTRNSDELTLHDPASNSLRWTGMPGEKVQLVFRASSAASQVRLSWDGRDQTLSLSGKGLAPVYEFDVPFYASVSSIAVLGFANFYVLGVACLLIVWTRRAELVEALGNSMPRAAEPFRGVDGMLLGGAFVLALLLRVFHLGSMFPAVDEYYHLIAAKQIIEGAPLTSVYARGLWLVTIPISVTLRVFGQQLWAARLVGVVFNSAGVIPLYFLARRINRPVATLGCGLYATSPWIITFARVAREYAYDPFYFLWIIYFMVVIIEEIPQGFVFLRQWREIARVRMLLLAGALIVPPVYALSVDSLSTFRAILIAYLVFGVFVLLKFDWRDRVNWPVLALVGTGVVVGGRSWYQDQGDKIVAVPRLNALPIEYFLPNPQQQWYFNGIVVVMALAILVALAMAFAAWRLNLIPAFIVALFGSYIVIFALFSKTFFHTRHLLSTELWYIGLAAIGLYGLWGTFYILLPWKGRIAGVLLAGLLTLALLNVHQILLPSLSNNPDMPISEDYLHDLSQVQNFLRARATPGDALISTVYGLYVAWEGQPTFDAQYRMNSQMPREDVFSIVRRYPSGWIVIDQIRLKQASISVRDLAGQDGISYAGLFGDQSVWRWQHTSSQSEVAAVSGRAR